MKEKPILFLPGPVTLPLNVDQALCSPMIGHRTERFHELFSKTIKMLRKVFMTREGKIFLLTSSGTGAVEASILNCFSPQDKVIVPIYGAFSRRASNIMKKLGVKTIDVKIPLGEGPETSLIEKVVTRYRDTKGIFIVYNDTSPGVFVKNLPEIAELAKNEDLLVVVDAISILGGEELLMDKWNIDVVIAATQKCLSAPPGISIVAINKDTWRKIEEKNVRSLYFDFKEYEKFLSKSETPFTPAINLIYGLERSLKNIFEVGLNRWIQMHRLRARIIYSFFESVGIKAFVKEKFKSNTVLSFNTSSKIPPGKLKKELEKEFRIYIALGMDELKKKIIRIGNMGYIPFKHIAALLIALSVIFKKYDISVNLDNVLDITYNTLEEIGRIVGNRNGDSKNI